MRIPNLSPMGMFIGGIVTALVLTGGGAAAFAANGGTVIIGKTNVGSKQTVFKAKKSPVGFISKRRAPFTVNNSRKVVGLNVDRLDGVSSESLLRVTGKAADADKLDGQSSEAFLGVGGKAADADKVDGVSSESLALASGETAFVSANGEFVDIDEDGTVESLLAIATCPTGTRLTGGGEDNFTGELTLSSSPFSGETWAVLSLADPAVNQADEVVAYAVCYNPRGAVPGGTTLSGAAGATAKTAQRLNELKAKANAAR